MPEYEMRLRFTAASDSQAERLAEAWAGTCAAEYSTRYAGLWCARCESAHPIATNESLPDAANSAEADRP